MKVPDDRLRSSVRISLGAMTTEVEVEEALTRVVAVVERIRSSEFATFAV
jgi:cysteine desulfurase